MRYYYNMDNQQPSILEHSIKVLAKNAKFGDGQIWTHPECVNSKVIFTSINRELLEVKKQLLPDLFPSGINLINIKNPEKRFSNAKPIYSLASLIHPIFTEYKLKSKIELFSELTIEDLGLWYLDDGCLIKRNDTINKRTYKYCLCIGDVCKNDSHKLAFLQAMKTLFKTDKIGSIQKNNSKATELNKTWLIPVKLAKIILFEAKKYNVMPYKFPR